MFRCLFSALVLSVASVAQAQSVATLEVGGTRIRMEVPEGHVRVSERSPELSAFLQGMLPPSNRLVEAVMTESAFVDTLAGRPNRDVSYQIQVPRALETVDIGQEQWRGMRQATIGQLGRLDMGQVAEQVERQASETLGTYVAGEAEVRMGDFSRPALYGDDPLSVRFTMMTPVTVEAMGEVHSGRAAVACAMIAISGRVLYVYAIEPQDSKARDDVGPVRAAVDAMVARLRELNPAAAGADDETPARTGVAGD